MKDPREMTEGECRAEVCELAKRDFPLGLDGADAAISHLRKGWEWTRTHMYFRAENNEGEVLDIYCKNTFTPSEELWRLALIVWRSVIE